MLNPTLVEDTFARDRLPPEDQWPDLINLDRFNYPLELNCVHELLDKAVSEGHGARPCLRSDSLNWTYEETLAQVNRIANLLVTELGLRSGERVMLGGPNSVMMAACWLAVVKAGGVAVATMSLLRAGELAVIADKAQARIALCDTVVAAEYEGAVVLSDALQQSLSFNEGDLEARAAACPDDFGAARTSADDVCLIAFTSGTTGVPKGCIHFHREIMTICRTICDELLRPTSDDVFIGSPPLAFTFGLGGLLLFPLYARASAVMLEKPAPASLASAIDRHGATLCFTAPTAYRAILQDKEQYSLASLRQTISAGETLPRATYDAWLEHTGLRMIDGIGATELLHIFISAAGDDVRPGATGKPLPGWEARVVDEQGNEVADGEVGRLAVRGPIGCRYLDDERQLKYVADGWNLTGDAYLRDSEGYFWFQSRADDMIISAGYNIGGPEVEDALLKHDAVSEAAVVASPDAERGSIVKAFVVLAAGFSGDDELVEALQRHVKATIAPYKYPRAVVFVDTLPKTGTGKIQRFKLREQEQRLALQ
tara:strand:- start:121020 stop:122642 length:1623 start_codon:yes stop_codon:yes gene_type:complete